MKITQQQKRDARRWTREACAANGRPELARYIAIEWSARMTSSAGKAGMKRSTNKLFVRLSIAHWLRMTDDQRRETAIHEACHIIAGPGEGHGQAWARAMRNCGLAAERCHSFGAATDIVVRCGCREFTITARRRNKINRGASYRCRACRETIELVKGGAR